MILGVFRIQWYENSVRAETQTRWRALPSAAKKTEIMRGVPLSRSERGGCDRMVPLETFAGWSLLSLYF